MKKMTLGAFAFASAAMLSSSAFADSVTLTFPSSLSFYSSATNGSGIGPDTRFMWTTGDFVSQTFTGTGLESVDASHFTFSYTDVLSAGPLRVDFLINGSDIGSFLAPNSITTETEDISLAFSPIVGAGPTPWRWFSGTPLLWAAAPSCLTPTEPQS